MWGNGEYFTINSRSYYGCKSRLMPFIKEVYRENCTGVSTVADLFAGTGVVADYFNNQGCEIITNDILYSNYLSYITFFDYSPIDIEKLQEYIDLFNSYNGTEDNYFSVSFGGRYFRMDNARKIGWIREYIESIKDLNFREKAILITSLIYGADYCSNSCGHYSSFLKEIVDDGCHKFDMVLPLFRDGLNMGNECFNVDANYLAQYVDVDLVYLDPPYINRQYHSDYHVLENLARWDKPVLHGITRKPSSYKHLRSNYSLKSKALTSFLDLINKLEAKYILVSYSDSPRNNISHEDLLNVLCTKGTVDVFKKPYPQYVSKTSHNAKPLYEQLYLCTIE